jgi:hypothetical protein
MSEPDGLAAVEAIRRGKARYFRGVDTEDADLVRGILAENCVLDYTGCFTDTKTGVDHFPAMSIVVRGRSGGPRRGLPSMGIVTAHQGHHSDIEINGVASAMGI